MEEYEAIFASDLPEADKIAQAFRLITNTIMGHTRNEIELLRALNDREALVKQQIKLSTVQHVVDIFNAAYHRATGRRNQDE